MFDGSVAFEASQATKNMAVINVALPRLIGEAPQPEEPPTPSASERNAMGSRAETPRKKSINTGSLPLGSNGVRREMYAGRPVFTHELLDEEMNMLDGYEEEFLYLRYRFFAELLTVMN